MVKRVATGGFYGETLCHFATTTELKPKLPQRLIVFLHLHQLAA
jgi:hypothetical protein